MTTTKYPPTWSPWRPLIVTTMTRYGSTSLHIAWWRAYEQSYIANHLATNSSEWCYYFAQNNSGTYNNEWMIVDYNLFEPGKELVNNTLWVLEQLPGEVHSEDVTNVLKSQGYWASYNIP